jgi:hypothetical protein
MLVDAVLVPNLHISEKHVQFGFKSGAACARARRLSTSQRAFLQVDDVHPSSARRRCAAPSVGAEDAFRDSNDGPARGLIVPRSSKGGPSQRCAAAGARQERTSGPPESSIYRRKIESFAPSSAATGLASPNDQRRSLAAKAKPVGRRMLAELATIVTPEILNLIAKQVRRQCASQTRSTGDCEGDRSIGFPYGDGKSCRGLARSTIANILKRNAIEPAPKRVRKHQ